MTVQRADSPFLRSAPQQSAALNAPQVAHPFARARTYEVHPLDAMLGACVEDAGLHPLTVLQAQETQSPTHVFFDEHPLDEGDWHWDTGGVGGRLHWAAGQDEHSLEGQVEFLPKQIHGFG